MWYMTGAAMLVYWIITTIEQDQTIQIMGGEGGRLLHSVKCNLPKGEQITGKDIIHSSTVIDKQAGEKD